MKGQEKALEIVVVLFILIVVVYIILNLFQNLLGEQSRNLMDISRQQELKRKAQEIVETCQTLCDRYKSTKSSKDLYEFCTTTNKLDVNDDGSYDYADKSKISEVSLGGVGVCEDSIPCFAIVDCPMGNNVVNADACKQTICERLSEVGIEGATLDKRMNELLNPGKCFDKTQTFHWFNIYFKGESVGELKC